jgi:large subunit ribosomal protein L10
VAGLEEALRQGPQVVLSGYRGLSVKEMGQLRRAVRGAGGELRVVKKTLFRRALGEGEQSGLARYMEGPVAVTFVSGDAIAVLKEMQAFARAHEAFEFKGGWVDNRLLAGNQLVELAALPPREELLARLLACLSAPMARLVGVLQAVPRDLVLTLEALARQRAAEEGASAGA